MSKLTEKYHPDFIELAKSLGLIQTGRDNAMVLVSDQCDLAWLAWCAGRDSKSRCHCQNNGCGESGEVALALRDWFELEIRPALGNQGGAGVGAVADSGAGADANQVPATVVPEWGAAPRNTKVLGNLVKVVLILCGSAVAALIGVGAWINSDSFKYSSFKHRHLVLDRTASAVDVQNQIAGQCKRGRTMIFPGDPLAASPENLKAAARALEVCERPMLMLRKGGSWQAAQSMIQLAHEGGAVILFHYGQRIRQDGMTAQQACTSPLIVDAYSVVETGDREMRVEYIGASRKNQVVHSCRLPDLPAT